MVNRSAQAVEGSSGRALRPCNVKRELGGRLELFAKINGAHEVEGAHDAAVVREQHDVRDEEVERMVG